MNNTNFWIPKTGEELERLAGVLSENPRSAKELIRCHAWFGHFFDGHLGKVQANTSIIQGKPALMSDALVGICYQSGLVRRLSVVESTDKQCTVEAERNDEPPGEVHRFTFTWQMAQQMGLIKAVWNKQAANMLLKRCRSFICRQVFPEAVSGLYTIDEIADFASLPEKEIEALQARSIGFDDYNSKNASSAKPEPAPPVEQKKSELIDLDADTTRVHRSFDREELFFEHCDELSISADQVFTKINADKFDTAKATPAERQKYFYNNIALDIIRRGTFLIEDWQSLTSEHKAPFHKGLSSQYPVLSEIPLSWYEHRLSLPAFAETLILTLDVPETEYQSVRRAFQNYPSDDWRLFDYVSALVVEETVED